jgi:hypothetical protein
MHDFVRSIDLYLTKRNRFVLHRAPLCVTVASIAPIAASSVIPTTPMEHQRIVV